MTTGIKPEGLTKTGLKKSNIPEDYWEVDFSNFKGPDKARTLTIDYLKHLETMWDQGVGIIYVGPYGQGKTTLAMIVMKYLARANWSVYCTSLSEIIENIQKGWKSDEEAAGLIKVCREVNMLLIDDVGKEHKGQSGFTEKVFDNLIRHRTQHRLPTFITSNFTKAELASSYGEGVLSLLEGKLIPVVLKGTDYRSTTLKKETRALLA